MRRFTLVCGLIFLARGVSLLTTAFVVPREQPWLALIGGMLISFGAFMFSFTLEDQ